MKTKIVCMALAIITMSLAVVGCGRNEVTQSVSDVNTTETQIVSEVLNETQAEEKICTIKDTRDFYDG